MTAGAQAVFEALTELRGLPVPERGRRLGPWRVLSDQLDAWFGAADRDHDDTRQRALISIHRALDGMQATSAGQARSWISRIYKNARTDRRRFRSRDRVEHALREGPEGEATPFGRIGAVVGPGDAERRDLDLALQAVMDAVDDWLERNVARPQKRLGDRRRAEVAILSHVLGQTPEEVVASLGIDPAPGRGLVYKWIERGREQVLMPALSDWLEVARPDEPFVEVFDALREILEGARRADAGVPRKGGTGSVSPNAAGPSQGKEGPS